MTSADHSDNPMNVDNDLRWSLEKRPHANSQLIVIEQTPSSMQPAKTTNPPKKKLKKGKGKQVERQADN